MYVFINIQRVPVDALSVASSVHTAEIPHQRGTLACLMKNHFCKLSRLHRTNVPLHQDDWTHRRGRGIAEEMLPRAHFRSFVRTRVWHWRKSLCRSRSILGCRGSMGNWDVEIKGVPWDETITRLLGYRRSAIADKRHPFPPILTSPS